MVKYYFCKYHNKRELHPRKKIIFGHFDMKDIPRDTYEVTTEIVFLGLSVQQHETDEKRLSPIGLGQRAVSSWHRSGEIS